jgi:hypothetical protein
MKRFKLLLPLAFVVLAFSQLTVAEHHEKDAMEEKMASMTHLMITHEVKDAEHWLAAWRGENSRQEMFKANGAAHVHTFQNPDSPNMTGLVVAVTDMDALTAFLESEEGQAAAAADGVIAETLTMLVQAK